MRRVADGRVSNHLLDLAPDAPLESSGPAGTFVFNPVIHPPHLVGIAGGSGITPLMSLIRETVQRDLPRSITLIYGAPADIWKQPGWPVEVNPNARFSVTLPGGCRVDAPAAVPLIRSLENGGCTIPSLCRSGTCSLCRVKLLSGRVFQPPGVPVRSSDRRFGYIHACMSYPLSDLALLL